MYLLARQCRINSYLFRQWPACVRVPNWKNVLGVSGVVRCVWHFANIIGKMSCVVRCVCVRHFANWKNKCPVSCVVRCVLSLEWAILLMLEWQDHIIRGFPYEGSNSNFKCHLKFPIFLRNSIQNFDFILTKYKFILTKVMMEFRCFKIQENPVVRHHTAQFHSSPTNHHHFTSSSSYIITIQRTMPPATNVLLYDDSLQSDSW